MQEHLSVHMWAFVWAQACFQTPGFWSPVCRVAWLDQWRGIGLHTAKIRCSMARKLICGDEDELANLTPDSFFSLFSLLLGQTCPIDEDEQMALALQSMKRKRKEEEENAFPVVKVMRGKCSFSPHYFLENVLKYVQIHSFVLKRGISAVVMNRMCWRPTFSQNKRIKLTEHTLSKWEPRQNA